MTIEELRKKAQPESHGKIWHFERIFSIYITYFVIKTPMTANQVTVIDLIFGLIGCGFLFGGSDLSALIGGIFLYLFIVVDCVDGEVARYHQTVSKTSAFLEGLCHIILHPLKMFALGFGLMVQFDNQIYMIIGILSGLNLSFEQGLNWRREIVLGGGYQFTRSYQGLKNQVSNFIPKKLVTFLMWFYQEEGMYGMIMIAAILDFLLPEIALFNGVINFKGMLLIVYLISYPIITLQTLRVSTKMVKEHYNE